jgi:hypothetical protein
LAPGLGVLGAPAALFLFSAMDTPILNLHVKMPQICWVAILFFLLA